MSLPAVTETAVGPALASAPQSRCPIIVGDQVRIPADVVDLESFRRWARSETYPEHGWYSFLLGELWVDSSLEQIFSHNLVTTQIAAILTMLVETARLGYFFTDRVLLTHPRAGLSTEPDALFFFWDTLRTGRIRLVKGIREGFVELEGTPDMVLEIVNPTSVRKDTEVLRRLYWQAGVPEYWLVDARREPSRFDILRHGNEGYLPTQVEEGWLPSAVFGKAFQLTQQTDPLGHPHYTLGWQSRHDLRTETS